MFGGMKESSPRPWGCFYYCPTLGVQKRVFPTPVGVFLLHNFHYGTF